jgi:hypothetical protein
MNTAAELKEADSPTHAAPARALHVALLREHAV